MPAAMTGAAAVHGCPTPRDTRSVPTHRGGHRPGVQRRHVQHHDQQHCQQQHPAHAAELSIDARSNRYRLNTPSDSIVLAGDPVEQERQIRNPRIAAKRLQHLVQNEVAVDVVLERLVHVVVEVLGRSRMILIAVEHLPELPLKIRMAPGALRVRFAVAKERLECRCHACCRAPAAFTCRGHTPSRVMPRTLRSQSRGSHLRDETPECQMQWIPGERDRDDAVVHASDSVPPSFPP